LLGFVSVFVGAGLGAVLRWWLGARLNPVFPPSARNAGREPAGGLLIGIVIAWLNRHRRCRPSCACC